MGSLVGQTEERTRQALRIHTHPGCSAAPSSVDERTFAEVFGRSDWAVIAILAREGQTFARLQFLAGPGGSLTIPVKVDWSLPFEASAWARWQAEYEQNVRHLELGREYWWAEPQDFEFDEFQIPKERQQGSTWQPRA